MHSMCHRAKKNIHFIWNLCAGCLKLIEAVRFWNRIYFFLYHKSGFVCSVAIISNSMNNPTDNLFAPTYQNRYRWNESFSMTSNFLFPAWTNNWKKKQKRAARRMSTFYGESPLRWFHSIIVTFFHIREMFTMGLDKATHSHSDIIAPIRLNSTRTFSILNIFLRCILYTEAVWFIRVQIHVSYVYGSMDSIVDWRMAARLC